MPSVTSPRSRGWLQGHAAVLAILVVAALVVAEGQPLHVHAGEGFYNESHVLCALATLNGAAPAATPAPESPAPAACAHALPADIAALPGPACSAADSRAPPLA